MAVSASPLDVRHWAVLVRSVKIAKEILAGGKGGTNERLHERCGPKGCANSGHERYRPPDGSQGRGHPPQPHYLVVGRYMSTDHIFFDASDLAIEFSELRARRGARVTSARNEPLQRPRLTRAARDEVLSKTGGRCHICGGPINGNDWQADHILARSAGGKHSLENYLPAHSLCNNYRWHYGADEFQWILKLGVWMRTQIEKGTPIGQTAGEKFCEHERRRARRRKLVTARKRI